VLPQAGQYLSGLMQARRATMLQMAEVVPESDSQALHHFLSVSDWDSQTVMDQVATGVDAELGGTLDSCLVIDETSFPKKGKKSVGVARQWCGTRGKTDSCQVGVFASLGHGSRASLIDARLYLPREWTDSERRCRQAGVPEPARSFRTKPELALEMVRRARSQGLRFRWVAAVSSGAGQRGRDIRHRHPPRSTYLRGRPEADGFDLVVWPFSPPSVQDEASASGYLDDAATGVGLAAGVDSSYNER